VRSAQRRPGRLRAESVSRGRVAGGARAAGATTEPVQDRGGRRHRQVACDAAHRVHREHRELCGQQRGQQQRADPHRGADHAAQPLVRPGARQRPVRRVGQRAGQQQRPQQRLRAAGPQAVPQVALHGAWHRMAVGEQHRPRRGAHQPIRGPDQPAGSVARDVDGGQCPDRRRRVSPAEAGYPQFHHARVRSRHQHAEHLPLPAPIRT
jgi:hypothetical protein